MAKSMNWIKIERLLRERRLRLFSPLELQRLLGVSAVAARFLVHRYAKQGALLKLRNGLYGLADRLPPELAIANRLYAPSYVSFQYALAYHHLIPEATYTVTSATTRPTRTLTAAGAVFEYHRLKPALFTGYEPTTVEGETVLIATPEKALLDYLYLVDLKRATLLERLRARGLNRRRLDAYLGVFQRPSLAKLARCV